MSSLNFKLFLRMQAISKYQCYDDMATISAQQQQLVNLKNQKMTRKTLIFEKFSQSLCFGKMQSSQPCLVNSTKQIILFVLKKNQISKTLKPKKEPQKHVRSAATAKMKTLLHLVRGFNAVC